MNTASRTPKEVIQGTPTRPPATRSAPHLIRPSLFSAVAKAISDPIHTRVSQAPFSLMMSSHSTALPISIKPTHTKAIIVAFNLVREDVAQRASAKIKTPKTIFSLLDIGPMSSSSLRAISGASGVSVNSGGYIL